METTNKTSRKDLYMIDPRNIIVVEGFNSRVNFDIDSLSDDDWNRITKNFVANANERLNSRRRGKRNREAKELPRHQSHSSTGTGTGTCSGRWGSR